MRLRAIALTRQAGGAKSVLPTVRASAMMASASSSRNPARTARSLVLALIATATLAVGVLVYMFDRPAASVSFLPKALSFAGGHQPYFGALGGQLPDFVHVYAFILLTVAVSPWRARVIPICAFWWAVDSLFKIGQHPALAPQLARAMPAWFQHVPILENSARYFLRGTFDPLDLAAIALGTIAAFLTYRLVLKQEKDRASSL
jgi:hypothetical protein